MNSVKLFFYLMVQNIRAQIIYRVNFIIGAISVFILSFTPIITILVLRYNFTQVQGWSFYEIIFLVALNQISSGVWIFFFVELLNIDHLLRYGWFDRLLLRPRNILFSLSTRSFSISSLGILSSGILAFIVSINHLDLTSTDYLLLVPIVIFSSIIYSSIFLLGSSIAFWNQQSGIVTSLIEELHHNFNQYPLQIYQLAIQMALTYILPLGLVSYYPSQMLFNKHVELFPNFYISVVVMAILFPIITLFVWKYAIKKYNSAGIT